MIRQLKTTAKKIAAKIYGEEVRIIRSSRFIQSCSFVMSENYYRELHDLLHIAKVDGYELTRTGSPNDGGYIMLDDFHDGGIAYSFGIDHDVSWDMDMASRGYDIFMYDHTIDGLPEENQRFHFFREGIADGVTNDDRLKTLEELIQKNHHQDKRNMILKMDVEGAEWGFIENVKPETLAQFEQILFEFHDVVRTDSPERVLSAFRKLNATHKLVHLHANNHQHYVSAGGKNFCNVIEASYVIRDKYRTDDEYDVVLPLGIDNRNCVLFPEIELGRWNENFEAGKMASASIRCI